MNSEEKELEKIIDILHEFNLAVTRFKNGFTDEKWGELLKRFATLITKSQCQKCGKVRSK